MNKKKLVFFLFANIFISISTNANLTKNQTATIKSASGVGKDVNIQLNIPIQVDNSNKNYLTNTVEFVIKIKNEITNYIKIINVTEIINYNEILITFKQNITVAAQDTKKRAIGLFNQTKDLFLDNKYKLIASGFISFYAYILFITIKSNNYLKKSNLWSSWKKEFSMNQLLTIPQKNLSHELVVRIQGRYIDETDINNKMIPFVLFIQDVSSEIEQLQQQIKLYKWINNLRICRLFPLCTENPEQINERIQKLLYFKNIFSSWIAEYKLSELKKKVLICVKKINQTRNKKKSMDLLYKATRSFSTNLNINRT